MVGRDVNSGPEPVVLLGLDLLVQNQYRVSRDELRGGSVEECIPLLAAGRNCSRSSSSPQQEQNRVRTWARCPPAGGDSHQSQPRPLPDPGSVRIHIIRPGSGLQQNQISMILFCLLVPDQNSKSNYQPVLKYPGTTRTGPGQSKQNDPLIILGRF